MEIGHKVKNADYLIEMMNIGAGNVATAFEQILDQEVNIKTPRVAFVSATEAVSTLKDKNSRATGVTVKLIGDIFGSGIFVVPEVFRQPLISKVSCAMLGTTEVNEEMELSIIDELSNIITGIYLTAIHDFCRLNIFHTLGKAAEATMGELLSEPLSPSVSAKRDVLMVENVFSLGGSDIRFYFFIIPTPDSLENLNNSIYQAITRMRAA